MLLTQNINRVKRHYMYVIFFIVVLSISLRIYYENKELEKQLALQLEHSHEKIHILFKSSLESLENQYFAILSCYLHTPEILELIKRRDVVKLRERIEKDYKELIVHNPNLHIMHFIDANNITILRMHNPAYYNDDLTYVRPMVRAANETKEIQKGFEVGKHGITYRITYPLKTPDGDYLGLLEFGVRPTLFSSLLKDTFDVQTEILVLNDSLEVVEQKREFQKLGLYSITQSDRVFEKINHLIDLNVPFQMLFIDNRNYMVDTHLDLVSYDSKSVSKIVIAKDVTALVATNMERVFFNNILNVLILFVLWGLVYVILTSYTKKITLLQRNNRHLKVKETRLKTKLNLDTLTALYNRGYLESYYEHLVLKLPYTSVACVMMDIDFFKHVNDTHGHLVGDKVLMQVASLARNFFRNSDVIVRYGGEEFIMFMENISYEKGCHKLEQFRKLVEHNDEFPNNLRITMSFGYVMAQEDESLESLVHRADTLLYEAKQSGRNRVVCDKSYSL